MSAKRERRNGRTRGACRGKRYDTAMQNAPPFAVIRALYGSQIQIRLQTAIRQGSRERDTTAAECKSLLRVYANQIIRYEALNVIVVHLKPMKQVKLV